MIILIFEFKYLLKRLLLSIFLIIRLYLHVLRILLPFLVLNLELFLQNHVVVVFRKDQMNLNFILSNLIYYQQLIISKHSLEILITK
jgi:hypothetical protein